MYTWLEDELRLIRTPRYHVVTRGGELPTAASLSPSYLAFKAQFGEALLYRNLNRDIYHVRIYREPKPTVLRSGESVLKFGHVGDLPVCFRREPEAGMHPVYRITSGGLDRAGDDFASWLKVACTRAREKLGVRRWAAILAGPPPFTSDELEIVAARRAMRWQLLGIDANGDMQIQITNTGERTLRTFSLGARAKDGRLVGGLRLPVADIPPGQTRVLRSECYKDFVPAAQMELFDLPDPQPEDRAYYDEFKSP